MSQSIVQKYHNSEEAKDKVEVFLHEVVEKLGDVIFNICFDHLSGNQAERREMPDRVFEENQKRLRTFVVMQLIQNLSVYEYRNLRFDE